jgi:ribosome maturation factor RimP
MVDEVTTSHRLEQLADVVRPLASALGLDLYDVEMTGAGRTAVLRVLVDREGGVDLEAISSASEQISHALDELPTGLLPSSRYGLEVSSPGLERPLRRPEHYRRAVGETVSVKIAPSHEVPARRVRGALVATHDETFELALEDGTTQHLSYDDVVQARTVFEWGPQPGRDTRTTRKPRRGATKEVAPR